LCGLDGIGRGRCGLVKMAAGVEGGGENCCGRKFEIELKLSFLSGWAVV